MVQDVVPKATFRVKSARRLRGSRACDCCHARKVRCDIDLNGPGKPCTNCRLDGQACVSYRGSKSRQPAIRVAVKQDTSEKTQVDQTKTVPKSIAAPVLDAASTKDVLPVEKRLIPKQSLPKKVTASLDLRVADLCMQARSDTTTPFASSSQLGAPNRRQETSTDVPRLRFGELSTSRGLDDYITFSYYDFLNLKSLHKVQPDDVRYLEFTGSLHIPVRPVLDEFVREYFLHVHPVLPVVDERLFWTMYDDSSADLEKPGHLSLFVFQSMLFAASANVPLEILRCCGFSSVRQARETFYRRAKTIFDLSKEQDYYAVAQGALLLTYYTTNTNPHINSQWLSIAIQNARVINAQLYHRDGSLSHEEMLKKKRLWWSCILRDRIMPLGLRRPIQITHEHFDFTQTFKEEDLKYEIGFSRVYDPETQRQLVKTIVAQCQLAAILTGVLSTCYPPDGSHCLAQFSPPDLELTKECIRENRVRLVDWYTNFNLRGSLPTNKKHISITLYTNIIYMYYYGARLALCQYEILVLKSYLDSAEEDHVQNLFYAQSEMQAGIEAITEIFKALIWLKLAQYLPISAVAYTALPLVLTALDLKMSSDVSQTAARRGQLGIYVEAMRLYKKKYDGTEKVTAIIEKLLTDVEPETRRICSPSGTSTPERSLILSSKSKGWCDILNRCPKLYLRLTLALDMAFARGKLPDEADFPHGCRLMEVDEKTHNNEFCSEKILAKDDVDVSMPCMQSSSFLLDGEDFHEILQSDASHINLDFADLFGEHKEKTECDHPWRDDFQNLFDLGIPV